MVRIVEGAGAIGLLLLAIFAGWVARDYPLGTLTAMGPGFAPRLLVIALGILALILLAQALMASGDISPFKLRPFLAVMGAIAVFAVLIRTAGLMPATFALASVASLAERPFQPLATIMLGLTLCMLAYAIFIFALGMPMRLFWF